MPEALRRALRAYSRSDVAAVTAEQPPHIIDDQASLCCTFLDSANARSQTLAVVKVLFDFLLPLLSYRMDRKEVEDRFRWVGADQKLPDYKAPKDTPTPEPLPSNVEELLRRIVRAWSYKELKPAISDFYKNPRYASRDRH